MNKYVLHTGDATARRRCVTIIFACAARVFIVLATRVFSSAKRAIGGLNTCLATTTITLSLYLLAGCQKPQPYGNFAGISSADLIQDAANALQTAYPPAQTRLLLLQPGEDAFGLGLTDSLRGGGYAVAEYAPPGKESSVSADAGLGFGYTLDILHEGGGLRLTLHIGDETLSRLYTIQGKEEDGRFLPVGYWVRREGRRHAGQ